MAETERHVDPTPERVVRKAIRRVLWKAGLIDRDGASEPQRIVEDECTRAALTAIESAGFVLMPKDKTGTDDLCQASPGIKGETVSREETGNADARKYKDLRESLRLPFMSFFMDGRNEHGTHLLPLPGCRISDEETIADQFDPRGDLAEAIFAEAEALGHEAGHVITTIWRWDRSDEYYDFVRVDPILTEAFYGTPEGQRDYLAQGDMLSCLSEEAQRADTESAANVERSLTPNNQDTDGIEPEKVVFKDLTDWED